MREPRNQEHRGLEIARAQAARAASGSSRGGRERTRPRLCDHRLEDFSAKVTTGLDNLDRLEMQDIIRFVVRRIEIDDSRIEVIFRVPSTDGPPGPRAPSRTLGPWQHCTGGGRANHRLAQPQSPRKRLRGYYCEHRNMSRDLQRQAALAQIRQSMINPPKL